MEGREEISDNGCCCNSFCLLQGQLAWAYAMAIVLPRGGDNDAKEKEDGAMVA